MICACHIYTQKYCRHRMKELHEFKFTNNIIVRDKAIPVDVYVSTPDGISYLEVNIGSDIIYDLTDGTICNRIAQIYDLIYQHIVAMSEQCAIDMDMNNEIIEVNDPYLIFKFYGVRKEQ